MKAQLSQEKVNHFIRTCRQKGLSVTAQRIAVFCDLSATDSHPSAEEIYGRLRKVYPTLSLATVYKTLETLEKHQFIRKTRIAGQTARYDANMDPHHHLICQSCGGIQDVLEEDPMVAIPSGKRLRGFEISDYRIHFHGVCQQCRPTAKS